jgi:hypothetical protein
VKRLTLTGLVSIYLATATACVNINATRLLSEVTRDGQVLLQVQEYCVSDGLSQFSYDIIPDFADVRPDTVFRPERFSAFPFLFESAHGNVEPAMNAAVALEDEGSEMFRLGFWYNSYPNSSCALLFSGKSGDLQLAEQQGSQIVATAVEKANAILENLVAAREIECADYVAARPGYTDEDTRCITTAFIIGMNGLLVELDPDQVARSRAYHVAIEIGEDTYVFTLLEGLVAQSQFRTEVDQ